MEIPKAAPLPEQVFSIQGEEQFVQAALGLFHFQYANNPVYQSYCKLLEKEPGQVNHLEQIPFLPISFFKTQQVASTVYTPEIIFESSGTSGADTSRHYVKDLSVYRTSFQTSFENRYGPASRYCILGLLPSYLERGNSSLVYMVADLIDRSGHPQSGFYLYDFDRLADTLHQLEAAGQKVILIGVTYALLDFAERFPMPLQHTIIMETGGMKGRKKELLREEVHQLCRAAFSVKDIHSEYGMTELLSQAYAVAGGRFQCPPWMKVMVREEDDPFAYAAPNRPGVLNIIDLANIYSCAFIATDDTGRVHEDGTFSVTGRTDVASLRGCSLLYA